MKWIGKHPVFSDLLIGGVLLTPPDNQYSYELTLPNDDGTSGQVLTTDGNGVLTWVTNSAGGTGVSMTNGVDQRIMTATDAQAISGEAMLTYDNSLDILGIGDDNASHSNIIKVAHSDDNGGDFNIKSANAGGTDKCGGCLNIYGGKGTGSDVGGDIVFYSTMPGSSGSSLNSWSEIAKIDYYGGFTQTPVIDGTWVNFNLIDFNASTDITQTTIGVHVDYDKSVALTSTNSATAKGIIVDLNDAATNGSSASSIFWGIQNLLTHANATGTTTQRGFVNTLSGGDTQWGIRNTCTGATAGTTTGFYQMVEDGGTDLYIQSSDTTTTDYFSLATGASGATTLTTVDGGGAAANITITADGTAELAGTTVTLDSAANIELEVGATSNYVQTTGILRGGNIGPISDTFIPVMPVDFISPGSYRQSRSRWW